MEHTLAAICNHLHGELIGDGSTIIRGINAFDLVQKEELTFADTPKRLAQALGTPAAAIIVSKDAGDLQGRAGIRVEDPKLAFALVLDLFHPNPSPVSGVHPTAVLGEHAHIEEGVSIQAHAVIGHDVSIGRGSSIGAGAIIGDGVTIGEQCTVDPNVVLYRQTQVGDRVQIHAGSVIGGDGFGYVFHQGAYVKVPQVGNVIIEDDVEIGCNVCIDRATVGSTIVKRGAKIDNLVQIAHNDRVGKHVILAGQVGLSGSVTIGDYSVLGGKAGVVDHVRIGDRAQIGAASVVINAVKPGETVWGFPARPIAQAKRQFAATARLPALLKRLVGLLDRLRHSEDRLTSLEHKTHTGDPAPVKRAPPR